MGLDMFLTSYTEWDEEKNDLKESFNELKYWRKYNWLHNYFCNNGICKEEEILYIIPREILIKLLYKITLVIKAKDKIKSAQKKLPTKSGCFYGDIEYDDWYFESLLKALIDITKLLLENDDDKFIYYASW